MSSTDPNAIASPVSTPSNDVTAKAGQHWDKLESIFEDRVAKSLNRLGVPSAKDVDALIARIDALSAAVDKLNGKPAAKKSAAPAKKAAAKKAPAKKAAAKPAARKTVA